MNKQQIIEQIEKSFSEYKGTNEAIDDAAFYIEAEFNKLTRQPLTDAEIEEAAKEYAENENSAYTNDYYGFIQGARFAINTNRSELERGITITNKHHNH